MAVVKCLMMQRDEELVLEPWLRYHGYLFGFENLYVFDNGSIKRGVAQTLARYEQAGVHVYRHLSAPEDYQNRGPHFELFIRHMDDVDTHDLVMPLDCDEFLALFTDSGLTCERSAIHSYLDRLIGTHDVLGVYSTMFNVPGKPGWFWPQRGSKRFFSRDTIGTLDRGFHAATSRKSDRIFDTQLTHLHYHHKPFNVLLEHSARKLKPHVDVGDLGALAEYRGPGSHMVRHFLVTEEEYLTQFDDELVFYFDGLSRVLNALGIRSDLINPAGSIGQYDSTADGLVISSATIRAVHDNQPILFSGTQYRAANPDIMFISGTAAAHYLVFGQREGRSLRAVATATQGAAGPHARSGRR